MGIEYMIEKTIDYFFDTCTQKVAIHESEKYLDYMYLRCDMDRKIYNKICEYIEQKGR